MKKCYNDISGAILAGGRNSRMGSPKYFLKVKGGRIIDSALDVLNGLFPEILIITDDRRRFSDIKRAKIVEDAIKGLGPVGGIYTGLCHTSREAVFFVVGIDSDNISTLFLFAFPSKKLVLCHFFI